MTTPYVSYVQPKPPRSYSFSTAEGQGARVEIITSTDLSAAVLTVEVDNTSAFRTPVVKGTASFTPGLIILELSAIEVDWLKEGFYRIRATIGNQSTVLVQGSIDYVPSGPNEDRLLDSSGIVRTQFIEPLKFALEDVFLRKDEIVVGEVDPVVLNAAVDSKLSIHVNSATPHPAYDVEMQNLAILFENRLI